MLSGCSCSDGFAGAIAATDVAPNFYTGNWSAAAPAPAPAPPHTLGALLPPACLPPSAFTACLAAGHRAAALLQELWAVPTAIAQSKHYLPP